MSADFPAKIPFACLKVSGLGEHEILGRVTSILDYQNKNPNYKILWIDGAQSNGKLSFYNPFRTYFEGVSSFDLLFPLFSIKFH